MKRPLIAVLILFILLAGALVSWTWYFVTQSTPLPPRITQKGDRPAPGVLPQQRAATAAERGGATRSILAQLDAFRRDDYASAARYQSSALRRNFGSTAAFQAVIKKSYPQFARYKSVTFGPVTAQGKGKATQINVGIKLIGQDGVRVQAMYSMVQEKGIYRVSGVSGGFSQSEPGRDTNPEVPPGFEGVAPLII